MTNHDRILEYIRQHPGCTRKDIRRGLGIDTSTVGDVALRLQKEGAIVNQMVKNPHMGGPCNIYKVVE